MALRAADWQIISLAAAFDREQHRVKSGLVDCQPRIIVAA